MSYNHNDPFKPVPKYPTIKFAAIGDAKLMTITEIGELHQVTDFETNLPAVSKAGNPKMQVRILVDHDGQDHALYVPQFSNMWKAIMAARADAGEPLAPMGVLWIQRTEDIPVEGNKILKAYGYIAKYKPPAMSDPFVASLPVPPLNIMAEQIKAQAQGLHSVPDEAPF